MQIAQVLSGYSLGGADLLRRAMGKKIKAEMDAQREAFRRRRGGARRRASDLADQIFDLVAKFAGYGFNKSHAAAYALVAYQTAYLKANYPVEFLAASMSLDIAQHRQAQRLPPGMRAARHQGAAAGHQPLGASSSRSRRCPTAARRSVTRWPRSKGVGAAGDARDRRRAQARTVRSRICSISRARLDRACFNKRQFENLVNAGAFDSAESQPRAELSPRSICCCAMPASPPRNARSNQVSLFGDGRQRAGASGRRCRRRRTGRRWSSCSRNSRRSAFISRPIRSIATARPGPRWAWCASPTCRTPGARGGSTRYRLAGIVIGRQGADVGEGQPLRLRPDVGHDRHLRGHIILGSAEPGPRASRQRQAALGYRRYPGGRRCAAA